MQNNLYIPNPNDIEYLEDIQPQIADNGNTRVLCIHRSHNDASKLLAASKKGYRLTCEPVTRCPYMRDHDHYPVEKNN